MPATTPSPVRPPSSDEALKASQTDENAVARWAAFFDSLPADEREVWTSSAAKSARVLPGDDPDRSGPALRVRVSCRRFGWEVALPDEALLEAVVHARLEALRLADGRGDEVEAFFYACALESPSLGEDFVMTLILVTRNHARRSDASLPMAGAISPGTSF